MNRRSFLKGSAVGGAISMLDWLGWFRRFGIPGSSKSLGMAEAVAQTMPEPKFLVMWFQEGGWDSYSMFSPIDTRNDATLNIPAGTLNPTPSWSSQFYRPAHFGLDATHALSKTVGNITYGYLAEQGKDLFPDMAVLSTLQGIPSHSTGRFISLMGKYRSYAPLNAPRTAAERSMLHAFCEQYGANYPVAHVAWHRWLADGELEESNYPEGTGYYEKLGPAYAHTVYGKTPDDMRARLTSSSNVASAAKDARIGQFIDNLHTEFLRDKNGESVQAFASAVAAHKQLANSAGMVVNPQSLFTDTALRAEFGIVPTDEITTSTDLMGLGARSKESPNTNVQAMMTYELMRRNISCGFWIESRQIRAFDNHKARRYIMPPRGTGQDDQLANMNANLWTPLKAFVARLKNTQLGTTGKTLWDATTIVISSEMGRTIQGDVASILATADSDSVKYTKILDQDCCAHWPVNATAFLGGSVLGNRQYGRVGTTTLTGIPLMPDGSLDPAYNPVTGVLTGTKSTTSVVPDLGSVYATALQLTGINPAGKGLNVSPPLNFIKKP